MCRIEDIFFGQVNGIFASLQKRKGDRSYEFKLDRLCHWTNLVGSEFDILVLLSELTVNVQT